MGAREISDEEFEFGPALVLPPARDSAPEIIFRTDKDAEAKSIDQRLLQRTPVENPLAAPFSSIALLEFFWNAVPLTFAGGFFIKPDVIVTAGHNLSSFNFTSIAVSPAFDAATHPQTPRFAAIDNVRHAARDVGIAIVGGFNAASVALTDAQGDADCGLAGYAIPLPGPSPRLTAAQARISFDGPQIRYEIPTLQGDSGSPVFRLNGAGVVAVHVETRPFGATLFGVGERMDEELQAIIAAAENFMRRRLGTKNETKGPLS